MTITLKKSRWTGLMRKEWAIQKWSFITILTTIFALTAFDVSSFLVGNPNENLFGLSMSRNTWFILHMYMGIFLLLTSLMNETKRQDVWLHSTASIRELIGSKLVFSTLAVMSSLLLSGALMSITAFKAGITWTEVLVFLGMIVSLTLNVVFLMVLTFLIWSIFQVLQSRIGKYAFLVTGVFVFVSTIVWAIIWFTDGFQKVKEMGPLLKLTSSNAFLYLYETNFILAGFMPDGAVITVGSLLLYIVLSTVLFIAAASLFEKKVRL